MEDEWGAFYDRSLALAPLRAGALSGLTFAVKDVFDIAGYVPGAGSPDWKWTHKEAAAHAEAVRLLLENGAGLRGTTHTDELMYSLNGENYHYGTPINPQAQRHIPGGSSSGSAVAVSAGMVDFALGTDTGGSVRIPASYCGVYGFRPTHGAVSMQGVVPLAPSFDTTGWMSRDARIMREVGNVLLPGNGQDGAHASFGTIVTGTDIMQAVNEECAQAVQPWMSSLYGLAGEHREMVIAPEGLEVWMHVFRLLQGYEIWQTHGAWVEKERPRFGPGVAERFTWASSITSDSVRAERRLRQQIRESMSGLLGNDGVLVLPTAPGYAPLRNTTGKELENWRSRTLQLCCIAGLAGLPQVSMPLTDIGGRPVGLSLIAGPGRDRQLLQLCAQLADEPQAAVF
ncbi:amidase [Paenibacillaceae bacterium]|nr:amidase [Paenibacillaceae bacterium]